MSIRGATAKRAMDLALTLAALPLALPLMAAIALWVRLDSPGPALFRQERLGRGGVPFRIHKFRTMHVHDGSGPLITARDDARISRAGRWLLEYERTEPMRPDPLTGWAGSGDTKTQVRLAFDSKDAALAYLYAQRGRLFDPACVDALIRGRARLDDICERYSTVQSRPGME